MITSEAFDVKPAFAIWLTGLPASGKSTIAHALAEKLRQQGVDAAVLESDALRRVLTPQPTYSETERDVFYDAMFHIGQLLVTHGVPVIFDATANRRRYRDNARHAIARFIEVHVTCPMRLCQERDPKGLYRRASKEHKGSLPGVQVNYEPPEAPELTIATDKESAPQAAGRIVAELVRRGYLSTSRDTGHPS